MIMNKTIHGFVVISLIVVAFGTLQAAPVREQRLAATVTAIGGGNAVVAGGGGDSSGGGFALHGTIGQAVAAVSSGGSYTLHAGFWTDGRRAGLCAGCEQVDAW